MEISEPAPVPAAADLLQAGYRYALALTHHREEAEDLVQEAWLNLCTRYGGVENRAVLFTAVRNLFIDHRRRQQRVHFETFDPQDGPEVPEIRLDEPCLAGEIDALLGHLKPAEREVIFLHYYLGHTAEEISQLRLQSRGTVLSLIHRSIIKLRALAGSEGISRNQMLFLIVVFHEWNRVFKH